MSTEKKTLIVAAVMPNHPSGTRRRAGFVFTVNPIVYEVTEEQRKEILADQYIRIITKGTALADAMEDYKKKSEGSSDNASELSDDSAHTLNNQPANPAPDAPLNQTAPANPESPETADLAPSDTLPADPAPSAPEGKPVSRMNKGELIAELEKKGLVAGKDFEPEAGNKKLAALLSSL